MIKKVVLIISCVFTTLTQNAQTELWGVTPNGGQDSIGNIYKTDGSGNLCINEFDFLGNSDGQYPTSSLMQAADGMLYGVVSLGGANSNGVLFQYDIINHVYNKKVDFNRSLHGGLPNGFLIQASNGKLYGLAPFGGINDLGTLFEYDPINNVLIKKIDFSGTINGSNPLGSLIQASDGFLYGLTYGGGINNVGVLFQYDPVSNSFIKKIDFNGLNGGNPQGSLIEASDGKLYGMTMSGGNSTLPVGVIFQFDPITNIYTKLLDLVNSSGAQPVGSFVQAANGKLYGLTVIGGTYNKGVLFQYDPSNLTYTKKIDFDGVTTGSSPMCTLIEASDGNLYGVSNDGGVYGYGTLFQFNPITDVFIKKLDFDHVVGAGPISNVIEINSTVTSTKQNLNQNIITLFPNPNNGSFTIDLKTKSQIIITNTLGETILKQSLEIGKQNLNIQSQSNGIYFVKITDAKGLSTTKKIVVQK
ncbi:MAG: T9SS type A sorting domain-containing protein [Bacteroidetes bacterium]|nr:T9SS type A sorting domain-containing protein [Bacteroidota bacterium]